jgi:hypothetical protein
MELPPQSFACFDEPVADRKKGHNQTDKNEVSHLEFPPILSHLHINHLRIKSASKVFPEGSRKSQFWVGFVDGERM